MNKEDDDDDGGSWCRKPVFHCDRRLRLVRGQPDPEHNGGWQRPQHPCDGANRASGVGAEQRK